MEDLLWDQVEQLPNLLQLHLGAYCFKDLYIGYLSTLQHLQCLSLRLVGRFDLHEPYAKHLLAAVQHLTQLRHLELHHCGMHPGTNQPQQQGFSALTASTQLTSLDLQGLADDLYPPVPPAACEHMFPPGRLLPNLKVLNVRASDPWYPGMKAAHVAMIAASCPALQHLSLCNVTPHKFDVSCLLQLPPGVTRVGGLNWSRPGSEAAGSLASLVGVVGSWLGSWAELLGKLPLLRLPP
jgi:hypothetical protein